MGTLNYEEITIESDVFQQARENFDMLLQRLFKKMEQNGWVERRRSQEDERIVMVSLTDKGRDTKKTVENMMTDRVRAALEKESEETFDNIRAGLASLCKVMERINSYE